MKLVLVAHGTRDPAGAVVVEEIAAALRSSADVVVAYADVRQPDVTSVLDGPAVVVPAFLASGYHVRVDIPAQIAASGRSDVVLAAPLGPDPLVVEAVRARSREAGFRRGDALVLAAAGSSDPRALADVRVAARMLAADAVGYVATAQPRVADVVRGFAGRRVAIASWLLAPGVFHSSLAADVVSAPIGAHPLVVEALLRRYHSACEIVESSTTLAGVRGGSHARCYRRHAHAAQVVPVGAGDVVASGHPRRAGAEVPRR